MIPKIRRRRGPTLLQLFTTCVLGVAVFNLVAYSRSSSSSSGRREAPASASDEAGPDRVRAARGVDQFFRVPKVASSSGTASVGGSPVRAPSEDVVEPLDAPRPVSRPSRVPAKDGDRRRAEAENPVGRRAGAENPVGDVSFFSTSRSPADLDPHDEFDSFWWYSSRAPPLAPLEKTKLVKIRESLLKWTQRFQLAKADDFAHERRWISFTPDGFMCNRLRAMVSTLVLAVLTDTLVSMTYSPIPIGWEHLFRTRVEFVNVHYSAPQRLPRMSGIEGTLAGALCSDLGSDWGGNLQFMHLSYWTPFYFRNPSLKARFVETFGDPADVDGVFRAVFTYFFLPVPSVRAKILDFASERFTPDKFTVGIHVRGGHDHRKPLSDDNWRRFRTCAEELVQAQARGRQVQFFVAADHLEAQHKAARLFGENRTIFIAEFINAGSVAGAQNALVDVLLLPRTDVRVLSPYSSYSELSASLAGLRGVFAKNDADAAPFPFDSFTVTQGGDCYHALTTEPSYHELAKTLSSLNAQSVCKVATAKWPSS